VKALLLDLDDTLVTYGPGANVLWLQLALPVGLQPTRLKQPLQRYIRAHQERQRVEWALLV
jgi:hypothetical protein